jgi:uncharacterized protein YegP (UPF0339 family)
MAARYELKHPKNAEFIFNLLAGNNQVIFTSQVYKEKSGALNVITSVQKNAGVDERYERKVAKDDESYFVLLAANKEVIGRSQLYKSKESLEKGIASVKKNGPTAPIKDLTHPAPKAK